MANKSITANVNVTGDIDVSGDIKQNGNALSKWYRHWINVSLDNSQGSLSNSYITIISKRSTAYTQSDIINFNPYSVDSSDLMYGPATVGNGLVWGITLIVSTSNSGPGYNYSSYGMLEYTATYGVKVYTVNTFISDTVTEL